MNRQWPDGGTENAMWNPDSSDLEVSDMTPTDNVIVAFKWRASLAPDASRVSIVELFPDAPASDFERRSFSRRLPVFLNILADMERMEEHEENFRRILLLAWIRRFARVCNSTVPWDTQEISSRLECMWEHPEQYDELNVATVDGSHQFAGFIIRQFMYCMAEEPHNIGLLNYIAFDCIDKWLHFHSYKTGHVIQSRDELRTSAIGLRIQRL